MIDPKKKKLEIRSRERQSFHYHPHRDFVFNPIPSSLLFNFNIQFRFMFFFSRESIYYEYLWQSKEKRTLLAQNARRLELIFNENSQAIHFSHLLE